MPVREVDMRDLALGVNAGVGAAGDGAGDRFARIEAGTPLVPTPAAPTTR